MTVTRGAWVSESRFGWNRTYLARLDAFLAVKQPNAPAEILPYGRRMPGSGSALRVQQPSGIDRSRPDVVPGVDLIFPD